jgi:GNAT superfamily N-acetyltransferase
MPSSSSSSSSSKDVRIRDYQVTDHGIVVPMWMAGFYEMYPYSYQRLSTSPTSLITFLSSAAFAHYCNAPRLSIGLGTFGILLYTPIGRWFVGVLFWQIIKLQGKFTMKDIVKVWMKPSFSHFYVAEVDGQIVGCIAIKLQHTLHSERGSGVPTVEEEASVWRLTVAPEGRKLGIGRKLMEYGEQWAKQQGAKYISLITGNPESQKFYTRLNYQPETLLRACNVLFGPVIHKQAQHTFASAVPSNNDNNSIGIWKEIQLFGLKWFKYRMLRNRLFKNKTILMKEL